MPSVTGYDFVALREHPDGSFVPCKVLRVRVVFTPLAASVPIRYLLAPPWHLTTYSLDA